MSHEPSMEEILSSIKKIIAEDGDRQVSVPRLRRAAQREESPPAPQHEAHSDIDVLELTDAVNEAEELPAETVVLNPVLAAVPQTEDAPLPLPPADTSGEIMTPAQDNILAETSVAASKSALAQLAAAKTKPQATPTASDNALETLVIEAMRPMLKEWLNANLPRVVEKMVAKEIARLRDE